MSPASPVSILLVEDNEWDARICREAFAGSKAVGSFEVVRDGVEAMERLRGEGSHAGSPLPDLILLDLNLPRKDGREVLAEIKADARLKHIPVLVLTTSKADKDVIRAYDLHANAYLNKPIDPDDYPAIVHAVEEFWFLRTVLPPRGT